MKVCVHATTDCCGGVSAGPPLLCIRAVDVEDMTFPPLALPHVSCGTCGVLRRATGMAAISDSGHHLYAELEDLATGGFFSLLGSSPGPIMRG